MIIKKAKNLNIVGVILLAVLLLCGKTVMYAKAEGNSSSVEQNYAVVMKQWENNQLKQIVNTDYKITPAQFLDQDNVITEAKEYNGPVTVLDTKDHITLEVNVKEAGLYKIVLDYYNDNESSLNNSIGVKINGEYQFSEARKMELPKLFTSKEYPFDIDLNGNEIMPDVQMLNLWQSQALRNVNQSTVDYYLFSLEKGNNEILLTMEQGKILVRSITIGSNKHIPTYEEYVSELPQMNTSGDYLYIQEAERINYKNTTTARAMGTRDAEAFPYTSNKYLMSVAGGKTWKDNGEVFYYEIDVPADGWYHLSFKAKQNDKSNTHVFRTITIDGELPFQEARQMIFPKEKKWSVVTLGNEEMDYNIYLQQGKHMLGIEVDNSGLSGIAEEIATLVNQISDIAIEIKKIIGNDSDTYRDWQLLSYLPTLDQDLYKIADQLEVLYDQLLLKNQNVSNNKDLTSLKIAVEQLRKLADDPEKIPNRMTMLSEGTGSVSQMLGTLSQSILEQPLLLDQIYLWQDQAELPKFNVNWFQKFIEEVKYFFYSFHNDKHQETEEEVVLDVWVKRGRNYVDLMQKMADNDFTKKTGIKVNLSIMPDEQKLILANTTDTQPDVALGVSAFLPYNLAIRNTLVDLRKFDDFSEVAGQFLPGSLLSFAYEDGMYALPETMDFYVLFYRKDLMEGLNIPIPNNWDEVLQILPELQRYGMNFYVPLASANSFKVFGQTLPFLNQFGARIYDETGTKVALNSEQGLNAMQFMTDLFTIYGLPTQVASFYQQFRNGDIPIGVDNFATYLKISSAASELSGKWDITLMPGVVNKDGEVERWTTGAGTTGLIFKKTDHEQASWEFLKWWLSTETQTEFGVQIEMLNGKEFIWNTANIEAFKQMPINQAHKEVILEQWKWIKEIQLSPASYMIEREISNVWNRIVLDGENTRSALDDAIIDMNRELSRRMTEFGYMKNDETIRNYKIPTIETIEGWMKQNE